jgi:adenylyltransferase/sulfurtransferase
MNGLPVLDQDETLRYSRHLLLDQIGVDGQRRIKKARVLIIGAGGLGSPGALYLAAAGVGTLGLVDSDVVDSTNLQRQILHGTSDIGRSKTASARDSILELNPHVHLETFDTRYDRSNALEILRDFDIVIDGSDNFATRYLTNDSAVMLGKPDVFGGISRFQGQVSVFGVSEGPCYRCLFRDPPPPGLIPNCSEAGVLGVLPGLVGTIQATETLKLILGVGELLVGRLLLIETLGMTFRSITVQRDRACPACGDAAHGGGAIRSLDDHAADYQEAGCTVQESNSDRGTTVIQEISASELADRIARGDDFDLIDVREPAEWEIARIEGARLVPLGTVDDASEGWDRSREVVLYCKAGVRSMHAAEQLEEKGFTRVTNVAGGIMSWTRDVDPSLRRY